MPLLAWLPIWLSNLLGGGWIRNVFGIRKDIVDTKKSRLEVEKLEADKRERNLITPATLDDVKKYDPKTKRLIDKIMNVLIVFAFIMSCLLTGVPRLPWKRVWWDLVSFLQRLGFL